MQKITQRQQKILECISKWLDEKGYPPSIREIAAETGIKSTRGVTLNLDYLEQNGYLRRDPTARSIQLRGPSASLKSKMLPLMGSIAAGPPLLANGQIEEMIPVPESISPGEETAFVLRVQGDSMQGEGIFDGDQVVVRPQPVAENGELVAVLIEGEATVKRFFREDSKTVRLEPANPAYQPIIVSLKDSKTRIIGKVIGLLRSYR